MANASLEIGRRAYEYYNQYITGENIQRSNIVTPDWKDFEKPIAEALEAFRPVNGTLCSMADFPGLNGLYRILKTRNVAYRVPIPKNTDGSRFSSPKSRVV